MAGTGWGFARIAALALTFALPAFTADAADNIGVTAAAQNHVDGIMGSQTTPLHVGSAVYANEHVRTAPASTAQLLFQDQTSLSVGPASEVTLDKFVYDPTRNTGDVVLSATRGAFRFVSGTQQPHNYQVRTPVATIGVRGTVVDLVVTDHSTSVILGECCADIQLQTCNNSAPQPEPSHTGGPSGDCLYHLEVVGQGFTLFDDGRIDGPFVFDGSEHDGVGHTTFPLHTTQMSTQTHDPETSVPIHDTAADIMQGTTETIIQSGDCAGTQCGCPDCGPGF